MKEICKNCKYCKPTYKSYYCDHNKAKKVRLQDACEDFRKKERKG